MDAVSAFAIDSTTGKLTLLNQVASGGADPCYITVDKTGKFVLVANYTGGSVSVFPILKDGSLGEASAFVQHTGHGTNPKRQERRTLTPSIYRPIIVSPSLTISASTRHWSTNLTAAKARSRSTILHLPKPMPEPGPGTSRFIPTENLLM